MQDQMSDIHISGEAPSPAQRLFCQFLYIPVLLLTLLCQGTQKFLRNQFPCLYGFGCIFFLFSLGSYWNLVFYCKLSHLQQQQLWRIWQWLSVTDQRELGPEPQWKSCAWQACFLGIVLCDPKWTKSERFDPLGLNSGHEFFCSVLSL